MIFKKLEWNLVIRVMLLFATLSIAAYLMVAGFLFYFCIVLPVIIYQVFEFYRFQLKAHQELNQFVESVHYRDFSRYFDVKHAPPSLQPLRRGFNEINSAFKVISKEKETQYQYLQKILELVDTGILSYEVEDGAVVWMNESLKRMLQLPYLKNIHNLQRRDANLYDQLIALKPGDNIVSTDRLEKDSFKVLLTATAFQTDGKVFKLIAFQNINEALDETESKAWQKLLSVMTHEIMNSIAPISSLADTLKNRLRQYAVSGQTESNNFDDLELGIDTIRRRSEGLLKFAETYRNLNKIAAPTLRKVYVRDLFENIQQLMQPTLDQKSIEMEIILKDMDLQLDIDASLVEQVLINLVVNSIEALKEKSNARIVLTSYISGNRRTLIKVADNGCGMPEELLDKIFIPFFTTRKNGSGIGLSLCKQIMMLHHGNLQVQSKEGEGTAFILQF